MATRRRSSVRDDPFASIAYRTSAASRARTKRRQEEPGRTRRLQDLFSVGPATVRDLARLGIHTVPQLAACDAQELYDRLCAVTGVRHDPCCHDVFAAAVAQARDPRLPRELCWWWTWSRIRKGTFTPML